jgi:acyl dehydratase
VTASGDPIPAWGPAAVEAAPMKVMALLLQDPNAIHYDPATVTRLGMGDRVVNQGPANLAYLQNMLAAWAGGLDRILGVDVRFLANVVAGDAVEAGGRVVGVEEAGGRTVVTCEVWLDVAGGRRALQGTATVVAD